MVVSLAPARNGPTNGLGRVYTPAEREAAYELWSTIGLRQDKETGRLMEIPPTTIQYWRITDDWLERVKADDESAAASSRFVVRAMVAPLGAKAVRALDRVLCDPAANANAVVRAAELALAYNNVVAPKHALNINASVSTDQDGAHQLQALDASELAALASAIRARRALPADTTPPPPPDPGRD